MISGIHNSVLASWNGMDAGARGAALVSLGSLTLVVMALLVKKLGSQCQRTMRMSPRSAQ
ncbi:MAG: hypothetical protein NTV56_12780 [Alphaproteobacteria bacterium]|nr:hypothetical protein [Alphaproteobacteria bacterium]